MHTWVREALVTLSAALFLAGPAAALVLPALPGAWRGPAVLWAILLAAVALVVVLRRRRQEPP